MSTSKLIVKGVTSTSIQALINKSSDFVVKLVLARLLFPKDFGLIGMAVVFSGFFRIFTDLGFGSAIIQRKQEMLTRTYISTAFWTNVVWSIFIFSLLCFVIGPVAASFYNEELLRTIVPALGLGLLISPLSLIQSSLLARELKFKEISRINNIANVSSGMIAIALAFMGAGYWAMVAQSVVGAFIEFPLYYRSTKWKIEFSWDKKAFHDIFGFGFFITLSGLVNRFSSQGDYLLVGKFCDKIELGIYSFAFILTDTFRIQIRNIIDNVMYPIYAKNQHDMKSQEHFMNKSVFFNSLIITPMMGVMFVSTELVTYVFGDKWAPSLIIVKIIAISVVIQIVTNSFSTIFRANNLSYLEFKIQVFKVMFFYFPLIFIGTYYYGTIGCSYAVVMARIIINLINLYYLKKYLNISPRGILVNFFEGILPTMISVAIVYPVFYFIHYDNFVVTLLKTFILVALIAIISYVMKKDDIKSLISKLKK